MTKRYLLLFCFLSVFMAFVMNAVYKIEKSSIEELIVTYEKGHVNTKALIISDYLRDVISDFNILTNLYEFEIFEKNANHSSIEHLQQAIRSIAQRKEIYKQIKIFDSEGRNVVQVNNKDGKVVSISETQLQRISTAAKPHSKKFDKNRAYISRIGLSESQGKIEIPLTPVLEIGIPIISPAGSYHGFLVITMNVGEMFELFNSLHTDNLSFYSILNSDGYWLLSSDHEQEWGDILPGRKMMNLGIQEPLVWKEMISNQTGQIINDQGAYSFTTLFPLREVNNYYHKSKSISEVKEEKTDEHFLKIVSFLPQASIDQDLKNSSLRLLNNLIFLYVFALFTLALLFLLHKTNKTKVNTLEAVKSKNRQLTALFESIEKVTHSTDEKTLLQEICDIVVRSGSYKMAWVGFIAEGGSKLVSPVAQSGFDDGYLEESKFTWDDTEFGNGPLGTAIKTGLPFFINNCLDDKRFLPWSESAKKRGYLSVGAFPLNNENKVLGTLAVYSPKIDFFGPEEVDLLARLASNLAYGIIFIRERKTRITIQDQLQETLESLEDRVKQRTSEIQKLNLALTQITSSVIITDKSGNIEYVNDSLIRLTGYTREDLINSNPRILKSETNDPTIYKLLWKTITSGKTFEGTIENRKKNGEPYWAAVKISPVVDTNGHIISYLGVSDDVTLKKADEQELVKAKHQADIANKAKSDFLANMSHEIRTPLNGILGMTQLCFKTELNAKQEDYLTKIGRAGEHLLGVINTILDYSKIEADKLKLENINFNLDDIFKDIGSISNHKARKKGLNFYLEIKNDIPNFLIGDPLRLTQVLLNLAGNAIKFTNDGEVYMLVTKNQDSDDRTQLEFRISDTGIGMTPSQLKGLFQSFSQADTSTTRKFGGTGLGLAISKRLVELMGGSITVKSEAEKGSVFTVSIWFEKQKNVSEESNYQLALKNSHILVIDNDMVSRRILADMLKFFHCNVTLTKTIDEGVIKLQLDSNLTPFDFVIINEQILLKEDYESTKKITSININNKQPCFILLTDYDSTSTESNISPVGIDFSMMKPVIRSQLFAQLSERLVDGGSPKHPESSEIKATTSITSEFSTKTILIVEDNEINRQIAKELLIDKGYRVSLAENGAEALEKIKVQRFDAILMDLQMPRMDGFEATEKIRKQFSADRLPIIAMTANIFENDREKTKIVGMNDFIAKPIDTEEFFRVLNKWLKNISIESPKELKFYKTDPSSNIKNPSIEIQTVNAKDALQKIGNNRNLYLNIIRSFIKQYENLPATPEIPDTENKTKNRQRWAHILKSLAGTIGSEIVQDCAKNLEHALAKQETEKIISLEKKLQNKLSTLIKNLKIFLENEKQQSQQIQGRQLIFDPKKVKELFEQLDPFLRNNMPKGSMEVIQQLEQVSWPSIFKGDFDNLKRKVERYQYEEAIKHLNEFKERL